MCYNGAWTSLCYNGFNYQEAFVVCRQLGLPATGNNNTNIYISWCLVYIGAQSLSSNYIGTGHGISTLANWICFGNETNLLDCLYSSSTSCSSCKYQRARIRCTGMIVSGNTYFSMKMFIIM